MLKLKNKLIIGILTLSMSIGASSLVYAESEYTDLGQDHWAYEAVDAMVQKGIIQGYSDGTFKPSSTVTYAEFIKMVDIQVAGKDVGNSTSGNWYDNYYTDAVKNKLFTKAEINSSKMNSTIPRKDMALIVSNAVDVTYDTALSNNLSDVSRHDTAILESYASGILTGYTDGTFKPSGYLTRAEAATVMWRLVDADQRVIPTVKETVNDGTTGTVLSDVISNASSYPEFTYEGGFTSYTIDTDYTKYGFSLASGGPDTWINVANGGDLHLIYFITDNKITSSVSTSGDGDNVTVIDYNTTDNLSGVDYIASYDVMEGQLLLIPNPFKS